ncbi:RimK/LysX family protein [Rubritalea sp.]|uniref:ATP-dependent zinc protease family protein n=1 Tax=Rubritalea sp. TaxID=2109375 RepID=UPI003F4ABEC1
MLPMCSGPNSVQTESAVTKSAVVSTDKKVSKALAKSKSAQVEAEKKLAEIETQMTLDLAEAQTKLEVTEALREQELAQSKREIAEIERKYELEAAQAQSKPKAAPVNYDELVMGEVESMGILEVKWYYSARIDTGATTCSIHAEKIKPFERDGVKWVRFELVNEKGGARAKLERKLERTVRIKEHDDDLNRRYVVKLHIAYGDERELLEFSLADRSSYKYPLLVGRNLLRGIAVVDVSKKNLLKKQKL